MSRPNVYSVMKREHCTDREPSPGWYWADFDGEPHGPYDSRYDAIEAVDHYVFEQGLLPDGSQP